MNVHGRTFTVEHDHNHGVLWSGGRRRRRSGGRNVRSAILWDLLIFDFNTFQQLEFLK